MHLLQQHPDLKISIQTFFEGLLRFVLLPVLFAHARAAVCLSVQKALKVLQPAVLEEFLVAVEGFEAFCSGPQLQDLQLLSDSVRKQWEV